MNKKFHYFYKITNLINNHFYYGVHNTDNLDDGYMGSGKRLHIAYKKYGFENFNKEILKFFDTAKEAFEYEAEIVTEQLINCNECYNICLGGIYPINTDFKGKIIVKSKNNDIYRVDINDPRYISGELKPIRFGVKLSKETKNKIGNHQNQKGNKNSQYGTKWINNGNIVKKIKKEELEYYLNNGWKLGNLDINHNIGSIYINKNGKNKKIKKEELEYYLDNGWKKGIINNYCWVHNENEEKMILKNELNNYIKIGYLQGRNKLKVK